jgi:hypothetical protein
MALILLTLECSLCVRFIGMTYDDPMTLCAVNSTAIYVKSSVHIQCVFGNQQILTASLWIRLL